MPLPRNALNRSTQFKLSKIKNFDSNLSVKTVVENSGMHRIEDVLEVKISDKNGNYYFTGTDEILANLRASLMYLKLDKKKLEKSNLIF